MTEDVQLESHDDDLDKAARQDRQQRLIWILVALLLGATVWILMAQSSASKYQAQLEARQKYTLAQEIADACSDHDAGVDLSGLCASATVIVKEGPPGPAGPPAFPFTFDFEFNSTTFTCTITASDALASCTTN